MDIKIYTKGYCPFCIEAKKFLQANNRPYTEIKVDDLTKEEFQRLFPNETTVPQITINGEHIPFGYTGLISTDLSKYD